MDMIYNLATVTIIAACRQNASFGLPGVGALRQEQPMINLNGRVRVSCLEPLETKVSRSKWMTRAWTYQEGVFSRRRLYFTDEQVYFECNNTTCAESLAYDLHHFHDRRSDVNNGPCGLFGGGFSFERFGGLDDHIQQFTKRDLTFQEDAINALSGIFRAFASMSKPIRHIWGIPTDTHAGSIDSCWGGQWVAGGGTNRGARAAAKQ